MKRQFVMKIVENEHVKDELSNGKRKKNLGGKKRKEKKEEALFTLKSKNH